jgi:hypothetical protein
MVEVLAVGGVDRALVLQSLEHHECGVQERDGQQDQRQHERHDHRRLDSCLDGHHAHQQAQQVGPAIAHEARGGREIVDQEAQRRACRERRQHPRFGAIEVEGDDRERAGDDHANAGGETVYAIGEVDDVHHHNEADHGQRRARVRGARVWEVQRAGERQGDRLDGDAEMHDDHGGGDLADELYERRQIETVVERSDGGDQRCGYQHAMPHLAAGAVARRQESEHRHEHAREDRQTAEQRRRAIGESSLARFVDGPHSPRQAHRERRQQRGHGRCGQECVKRVELVEFGHRLAHSIAGAGVGSANAKCAARKTPPCSCATPNI